MTTTTTDKCIKAGFRQSSNHRGNCRDCNHSVWKNTGKGFEFVCNALNIRTAESCVCNYYCNPCQHCRHLYDDSDESVGLYGYGCSAEDDGLETNEGEGKFPCPSFSPAGLASDGLFDQLANEEMARQYLEDEKEMARLYQEE